MTLLSDIKRHKGTLQFARRLLTIAVLLQLPILITIVLRQADFLLHLNILGDRQIPPKLNLFLWVAPAIFAIAGFTIVCRQLSLWEGDLENTEFAQRTRLLGSRRIAASIQFFFYLCFLVPVISLVPVFWARSQASTAIADLDLLMPARRR